MAVGDAPVELQRVNLNPGPSPGGGVSDQAHSRPPDAVRPQDLKVPPGKWPDSLAFSIAVNDFERASRHRAMNQDWRWTNNDNLYHANVPQRYWEGTSTPRSSLGVKLVQKQVESLLPRVTESLFNSQDGIFFDCFPRPGTTAEQSRACRELLSAQLDQMGLDNDSSVGFREEVRESLKSTAIHGTGILKTSWTREKKEREVWQDVFVPRLQRVRGVQVGVGVDRLFRTHKFEERINRPDIRYVSLRDFYIDPNHRRPYIQGAAYVCHRAFLSLEDLLTLGENDPSYTFPSRGRKVKLDEARKQLLRLVAEKRGPARATADTSKQQSALEAGEFKSFPEVTSVDLANYPFEVIEYWTRDRLVTILDRKFLIRNIANPFGFIPFLSIVYTDVLDAFYGKGLAEILEGEQRTQQGILNSRHDELALIIHGQTDYDETRVINKMQLRPRPGGGVGVSGSPKDAIVPREHKPVTGQAFVEMQQSEARAQGYTGVSDLVTQGVPSVQTSATRTKFGAGVVAAATLNRIQYFVENSATMFVVPLLNRLHSLNIRYLDPSQPTRIIGSLGKEITVDPLAVMNGQFKFEMRAASRATAKQVMQQTLPGLLQTLLNPGVIQALEAQGITPNVASIIRDTMDILGWRNRNDWFRKISPQEQQQRSQQALAPELIKFEKEKMRLAEKAKQMVQSQGAEAMLLVLEKALDQAPGAAPAALGMALDEAQQE